MKKILILILIIAFCFTLSACGTKEEFNGSPDDIPKKASHVELI